MDANSSAKDQLALAQHAAVHHSLSAIESRLSSQLSTLQAALAQDRVFHEQAFAAIQRLVQTSHERLETTYSRFAQAHADEQFHELQTQATQELKRIYAKLVRDLLDQLRRYYSQGPIVAALGQATSDLLDLPQYCARRLQPAFGRPAKRRIRLAVRLRLINPKRRIKIPLRIIVAQWIIKLKVSRLESFIQEMRFHREELLAQLDEIWNIIRYNLEGAVAEIEERGADQNQDQQASDWQKSREIGLGGLDRASLRLESLLKKLDEFHTRVEQTYTEKHQKLLDGIKADIVKAGRWRGRTMLRSTGFLLQTVVALQQKVKVLLAQSREGMRLADQARTQLSEQAASLRGLLGLTAPDLSSYLQTTDEALVETAIQRQEFLPAIYRRLFTFEPLELEEFLVGRQEALRSIAEAAARWQHGDHSSLLIHGEFGSGKSSLLNCAEEKLFSQAPVRSVALTRKLTSEADILEFVTSLFELPTPPSDFDDLCQRLMQQERTIVTVEGAHNLYVRKIGGFEALTLLLLLIGRTNKHHLWVLTMGEYAYQYLQRTFRLSDHFSHIVETPALSSDDLKRAILRRHQMSGFRLQFHHDRPGSGRLRRELRRARGDPPRLQAILEQEFFDQLYHVSLGNIYVALYYWLRSVRGVTEPDLLEVDPIQPLSFAFLERLSQDHLFSLAAILQHGELTVGELTEIFDWEPVKSHLIIDYFEDRKVIRLAESADRRQRYEINRLMLKPVLLVIQRRNIIH